VHDLAGFVITAGPGGGEGFARGHDPVVVGNVVEAHQLHPRRGFAGVFPGIGDLARFARAHLHEVLIGQVVGLEDVDPQELGVDDGRALVVDHKGVSAGPQVGLLNGLPEVGHLDEVAALRALVVRQS
jgi:hypothetical protein